MTDFYDEDEERDEQDYDPVAAARPFFEAVNGLWTAMLKDMAERAAADEQWKAASDAAGREDLLSLVDLFAAEGAAVSDREMTGRIVAAQLKQNTGRHLLDSGGIGGRHWEQDVARNYATEPHSWFRVRFWGKDHANCEFETGHNTWHWLVEHLSYEQKWSWFFHRVYLPDIEEQRGELSWYELMEEFEDWLCERGFEIRKDRCFTENTYNHQSMLDRVLQYRYIDVDTIPDELHDLLGSAARRSSCCKPTTVPTFAAATLRRSSTLTTVMAARVF